MRSVRLDSRREARLAEAARVSGKAVSDVIRTALDEHCDRLLGTGLEQRLADVIGSVAGDGSGYSERTGDEVRELLARRSQSR